MRGLQGVGHIRGLLIGKDLGRERRHHLPRRADLNDEGFPYRRIDQFGARAATLAGIAMALETSDGVEQLLAIGDVASGRALGKSSRCGKHARNGKNDNRCKRFEHVHPP